jgi:hypothetical protein
VLQVAKPVRFRVLVLFMLMTTAALAFAQQSSDPDAPTTAVPSTSQSKLPDAPSTYEPLSAHQKFNLFLHRTYSPYTFVSAAAEATWAQIWAQWPEYGGGMQGWGKRFGATLADTESRRFIQTFFLSTVLHQDPRYFHSQKKGFFPRGWYAATRVLVTRDDDGNHTFNSSEFLGTLFIGSLQNAYYPRGERSFGNTMNRFAGALGSDATSNILREFWPDIRRIFRKHEPEKVRQLEEKVTSKMPCSVTSPDPSTCH